MNKDTPQFLIPAPIKGIQLSGYFNGATDVRNIDNKSIPGLAILSLATAKKSGTTITDKPLWAVANNDANVTVYVLGDTGKVWKANDSTSYATWTQVTGNTTTNAHGNGLAIWNGYLIVARDTALDAFDFSSTWTNAFATLVSDTSYHPMLASVDDKLYIGAGRYVSSLVAVGTFNPASGATFTFTSAAVTLPFSFKIKCLEELGANLLAGTWVGSSETHKVKIGKIFTYNRSSLTLGIPIDLKESGINQMLTVNNQVFVQAGISGKWFVTDGSYFKFLTKIPENLRNLSATSALPGAICQYKNRILSGITIYGSFYAGSGVWSFNLDGSGIAMENSISATNGTDGNTIIGCVLPVDNSSTNEDYIIGWYSGTDTAQGVDLVGEDNFTTSYSAYFDSEWFNIGTTLQKKQTTTIEFYFEKVLASNEGIKLSYRTSSASSFTVYDTYGFSTDGVGATTTFQKNFAVSAEQLQVRLSLTGTTTSPKFKYAIIR